ncbi:MAG: hypothetical protein U0931_27435 [Vulcanimicrobiota bacterium]
MRYALLVLATIAFAFLDSRTKTRPGQADRKSDPELTTEELENGVTVTRMNGQVVRIRGGIDQVLGLLDPSRKEEAPPDLPESLDVNSLKKYYGGCPHCGKMSLCGEGLWRYRILSRTRERWDNTTTYLARCKQCLGLMKATVDHND